MIIAPYKIEYVRSLEAEIERLRGLLYNEMRAWTVGNRIDAIREEYELHDYDRTDSIAALVNIGLTDKQARQLFKSWRKKE